MAKIVYSKTTSALWAILAILSFPTFIASRKTLYLSLQLHKTLDKTIEMNGGGS